ncbi:methyl-accepting chemotaxis protein [Jannaschia rubra]|uniref:methyl-accepting chemotaxis protein n=1 Tax=Jannaschia rubra TaxID=282197 RepID=UPI0024935783|nr:methyl-accepting chemotaxis protein [Jannaschia rubra]
MPSSSDRETGHAVERTPLSEPLDEKAADRWFDFLTVRLTITCIVILTISLLLFSVFSYTLISRALWNGHEFAARGAIGHLIDRLDGNVRAGSAAGAQAVARSLFEREGSDVMAVRIMDEAGDVILHEVKADRADPFADLATRSGEIPSDGIGILDRLSDQAVSIVRAPMTLSTARDGPHDGILEVVFDIEPIESELSAAVLLLLAYSAAAGCVIGPLSFFILQWSVARPLSRTIDAMQDIASDRIEVDLPTGGAAEIRRMNRVLAIFRANVLDRIAYAERSALAEARNAELQAEQHETRQSERMADEARERAARVSAERELAEERVLHDDLREVLTAAAAGDFHVRMATDGVPTSQLPLRGMLNDLIRRVQEGIGDVIEVLVALESGQLWARMDGSRSGAFEQLKTSTNAMAQGLETALNDLSQHATEILDDSSDLSASAEDLSKRTERTAGSLAETTNALEQIVGSIAETARLTAGVRSFAENAREEASRSDLVVRNAVQSMKEIQGVSAEISRTLGVINDIAFQTNLLALNAGVEAARAGESGRGFAVVASEVRALAQRASEAAHQIGGLIATNSEQIERGVQRVGRTSETLATLGNSIGRIGDQVAEIAHAAEAQSTAAAEINRAMMEIDGATQQNTAMFEEITTANLSLKGAASQMLRLIDRFERTPGTDDLTGSHDRLRALGR